MISAMKYLQVAQTTWKSMLAYQADTWFGAIVSGFRVLMAFLLWQAVFAGRETVAGYTLPMMVTYSLLSSMIGRLQNQESLAWQLAEEVRAGVFSKYLVHPMPVIQYFLGAFFGQWSFMLVINGGAMLAWLAIFARWVALTPDRTWLWAMLILPLGGLCMFLLNHAIGLLSLKFQDITGMMFTKGTLVEFLSGMLVPLDMLPPAIEAVMKFTPFYYIAYYPARLIMGTPPEPPLFAALILTIWCFIFYAIAQAWFAHARKFYEGVGI
jgi:ABC-2 type transport system permease protein